MTSDEIRERFLGYFERKGHTRVASSSVIPWGDPTLMFTNAGMNQFKNLFLGREKRDYTRATTCQKCIRAGGKHNDLDEVGHTTRHGTFLEMLGNFSFGDYFKREAIAFAWEFMVQEMGLKPEELLVSVYSSDNEAFTIWRDDIGVPEERILRFGDIEAGDEENFWSMGTTGPCGPCSEIYVDRGRALGPDDPYEGIAQDSPRFIELWNLVFMQFNRDEAGKTEPLPKPSIDTGLGLERMAMVKQGKNNIFETDILGTLVSRVEEFTGKTYTEESGMPFRVAADHMRTLTFAIADGAIPSNEGRGYVLRRILRRASRHLRQLGSHEPLLYRLVGDVVALMQGGYPELSDRADYIAAVIKGEEERFLRTLDQGIDLFEELAAGVQSRGGKVIEGTDAFRLYDTYGFPVDLTRIMAEEKGMTVDMASFQQEMEAQRKRAREASSFTAAEDTGGPWTEVAPATQMKTEFVGYDTYETTASLLRWREGEDGAVELVFDRTPFYARAGGQVNDIGYIKTADGSLALIVEDVAEYPDAGRVHRCRVREGTFDAGLLERDVYLHIDPIRRENIMRNHSATHLLQAALQQVLGPHVRQSGSYVDNKRLRFDFNHFSAMTSEEIELVERKVYWWVMNDMKVDVQQMGIDEARATGAMSLFDEKYGETVRVVSVGDISKELCGGTHVSRTGQIGMFRIVSESSVAAGIRRIEAVTGGEVYELSRQDREFVTTVSQSLTVPPNKDLAYAQIGRLWGTIKELQSENKKLRTEGSGGDFVFLREAVTVDGVRVASGRVTVNESGELKEIADTVRARLKSGVGVIGAVVDGKVSIVVMVTDDVIQKRGLKAGDLIKDIAGSVGGSGGGRPHLAQAGGRDPSKLDEALRSVPEIVAAKLKG
ncbi:alanine--tRNA ligase [Candidatus Latescibacterota bacterium]